MSDKRLNGLLETRNRLIDKLNRLEENSDILPSNRVEEHIEADYQINAVHSGLKQNKQEIIALFKDKANALKHKKSFDEAMKVWGGLLTHFPDQERLYEQAKTELRELKNGSDESKQLLKALGKHLKHLRPIWQNLTNDLKNPNPLTDLSDLKDIVQDYLNGETTAEEFIMQYELMSDQPAVSISPDIEGLVRRIVDGEMVLFLGADVAKHYHDETLSEADIAQKLACDVEYQQFKGELSAIAEYYQANPNIGTPQLLKSLYCHLPDQSTPIGLYEYLAQSVSQQVLISTAYDDLLEQAFYKHQRKFVRLSPSLRKTDEYEIGQLHLFYSDKPNEPPQRVTEEELSRLNLLEEGYSLIYKMRGNCVPDDDQEYNFLMLSERQFFDFARYAEKIIPNYLSKVFRRRGFLFLGYRPRSWEDRLMVRSLLYKRRHTDEPCYVATVDQEPLEDAHWKHHRVERYQFDLATLDQSLQAFLEKNKE